MIKSSINARKSDRRTLIKQGWQHPYVEKHGNKSMEWKNGQSEKRERMCKKSRKTITKPTKQIKLDRIFKIKLIGRLHHGYVVKIKNQHK